jgi:hypothetical protein
MAEEVSTGGLKKFSYGSDNRLKLDNERKSAIATGYEQYDSRKAREKRNRMIFWIVAGLVVLAGFGIWKFLC